MKRELHILVCLKVVPKSEEVGVDRTSMTLDRANARQEVNPPDMNALETALALKDHFGARISLLSMGPPFVAQYLRIGLAMGADSAYLLSDRALGGADTLATSLPLARAIEKIGAVDLVLCGEESSDGATAQVPPGIAAWLNFPQATYAMDVEFQPEDWHILVTREIRDGEEILDVPLPAVVSVKVNSNEPRFIHPARWDTLHDMGAVQTWTAADLGLDPEHIGFSGSPTSVAGLSDSRGGQVGRRREMVTGTPQEEARILYERISAFLREGAGLIQEAES